MCTRLLLLVVALGVPVWAAAEGPSKDAGTAPARSSLQLVLTADRDPVRMSDTLRIETRLNNTGSNDIYIWDSDMCWNPARGLSMRITNSDGKDVQGRFLLDCLPPPPSEGDPYQFLKIAPHAFYGQVHDFVVSDLVNGPGQYTLTATFNSFLSDEYVHKYLAREPISKLPVWTMEMSTVSSNSIHFTVRK